MQINPWSSSQYADYERLREEFGIGAFDLDSFPLPDPSILFRRGVVFGHRDFNLIHEAMTGGDPFSILTGLMPSGKMHFGHKMVIDQVLYFQRQGANVHIAVADIEAWGARGMPFELTKDLAIEEYLLSYIAMGLQPEKCEIYFQSKRKAVTDIAHTLSRKVNLSEMKAIYGFEDSTNMAHMLAPLVQVGDILHVQLEEYDRPLPTLVPVGIDQDPHLRLTRGIASAYRFYNVTFTEEKEIGIFVKGDQFDEKAVKKLLDQAERVMKELGYSEMKKIPKYRALYVRGGTETAVPEIQAALSSIEVREGGYGFYPPSSTYHRFISGLTGGKMSSSDPNSAVFLSDEPKDGGKKIKRAKTGGRIRAEEQREKGGEPFKCSVYEMFHYHMAKEDAHLDLVYRECVEGTRLCGGCKNECAGLVEEFLTEFRERKEQARDVIGDYVVND
jgi:tryptophanyl-tRNA synthetase